LEKAHESGVIHRDIKPANLFLDQREGDIVTVKVLDFGVAKIKEEDVRQSSSGYDITKTGTMLGSPLYMSPEQARGLRDIDHRSDLWSVGVVLYRMLAGRAPFQDAESLGDLIVSICSAQTPPLQDFAPWVPRDIAAIVHACLVADRSRRFASARDMIEALLSVLPEGDKLTKDMLVGASEVELQVVAQRFDVSGSGADQLELTGRTEPQDNPVVPLATIKHAQTTAATPTAEASNDGKSRLPLIVAMGVGLAVGAYGVYRFTAAESDPSARGLGAASASASGHAQPHVVPTTAAVADSARAAEPVLSASSTAPSASVSPSAATQRDAVPVATSKPIKSATQPGVRPSVRPSVAAPPPVSKSSTAPVRPAPPRKVNDPFGGRK
jgi:serine/threonine-protein kinase